MLRQSLFRTISIGIVAKDIEEDSVYVDVYPIELQLGKDGELTAETLSSNTVTDVNSGVEVIKLSRTDLIKAKWLPDGDTNRLEPPTVCKGEKVRILQYGDSDEYYWNTPYNELDKRKREKRTIVISNKRSTNIPVDELLDNSYYATVDSINKIVHIHTSDTDGEFTTYDIAIDTDKGLLEITDGRNNRIILDSPADTLTTEVNNELIDNSTDKTDNVKNHYQINLKTLAVSNGSDELIKLLTDFAQVVHDATGTGNLGASVPMDGGTQTALADIKNRLKGFM